VNWGNLEGGEGGEVLRSGEGFTGRNRGEREEEKAVWKWRCW